jgi:ribosomal protein S18 acetylase RimI-like enzyme
MPEVTLRPVGDDDEAFLRALYATTRAAGLRMLPTEMQATFADSQYDLQRRHYLVHHPGATWSVVELDGRAVGRFVVDRTVEPWLLVDISIHPDDRNRGIGTRLITDLRDQAFCEGNKVALTVWSNNHGAKSLYGRLGFSPLTWGDGEHAHITMTT